MRRDWGGGACADASNGRDLADDGNRGARRGASAAQHMMSGKFLSGVKNKAEKQKENLKLVLEEHGSINSAMRVRRRARLARRRRGSSGRRVPNGGTRNATARMFGGRG